MPDVKLKAKTKMGSMLDWITGHLTGRYAFLWATILFVGEIFLIVPLDIILIFLAKKHPHKMLLISFFASCCSVFSGLLGYLIGSFAFEKISPWIFKFMSKTLFLKLTIIYKSYESLVVFCCCLLPMPFKVTSISAGFCKLALPQFLVAIFFARFIRFSTVSFIGLNFKNQIIEVIERNSTLIAGIAAIILLLILLLWINV